MRYEVNEDELWPDYELTEVAAESVRFVPGFHVELDEELVQRYCEARHRYLTLKSKITDELDRQQQEWILKHV